MKVVRIALILVIAGVLALPAAVTHGQDKIELQLTWWGSQTRILRLPGPTRPTLYGANRHQTLLAITSGTA